MLNHTSEPTENWPGANSAGVFAGASPIVGAEAAIAAPAVAQNGQKCGVPLPEVRSAQKWNCAARNTSPSNRAQVRILLASRSMTTLIVGRKCYLKSTAEWNSPHVGVTAQALSRRVADQAGLPAWKLPASGPGDFFASYVLTSCHSGRSAPIGKPRQAARRAVGLLAWASQACAARRSIIRLPDGRRGAVGG
jgi:hypothetical protein